MSDIQVVIAGLLACCVFLAAAFLYTTFLLHSVCWREQQFLESIAGHPLDTAAQRNAFIKRIQTGKIVIEIQEEP